MLIDKKQQFSPELHILLCSLRLMQVGVHHRNGPEINFTMTKAPFRLGDAKGLTLGDTF